MYIVICFTLSSTSPRLWLCSYCASLLLRLVIIDLSLTGWDGRLCLYLTFLWRENSFETHAIWLDGDVLQNSFKRLLISATIICVGSKTVDDCALVIIYDFACRVYWSGEKHVMSWLWRFDSWTLYLFRTSWEDRCWRKC